MKRRSWKSDWAMWKVYLDRRKRDPSTFDHTDVAEFYDRFVLDVAVKVFNGNIHWGVWPDGVRTIHEAALAIVDLLGDKATLAAEDRCLDVGCGVGGPAVRLAKRHGCRIVGINVSREQIATATALARAEKIDELVHFCYGNAMEMPFEAGEFDVVYALDSLMHMNEKERFIAEASRVLRRGGRLTVLDLAVDLNDFSERDLRAIRRTQRLWATPDFVPYGELMAMLHAHSFEVIEQQDLTEDFRRSMRELGREFSLLNMLLRTPSLIREGTRQFTPLGLVLVKRVMDSLTETHRLAKGDGKNQYFLFVAQKT